MSTARPRRALATIALVAAVAVAVAACGGGNGPGASAPPETSTQGAPAKLARNAEQGDRIVGEGKAAFERRLAELRGYPVVVNQWASWCESCRFEFPFFAEAAKR